MAIATSKNDLVVIPISVYIAIIILSPVLIFLLSLFQKYLKKEILAKANLLTVGVIRIEIIELLKNYFGEDRIGEQEKIIKNIFSEITDMPLCQISDDQVKTPSVIEFKPLHHIFRQNGKATILISFELNEDGGIKMNYTKNEEPGDFKQRQFPHSVMH
ncbi:MAG: hypothetical protein WCJ57_02935 [Candidatus Falkowbacteria bacterium]